MSSATAATPTPTAGDGPKLVKKASANDVKSAVTQTVFGCPHTKNLLQQARALAVDAYTKVLDSLHKEGNLSDRIQKVGGPPSVSIRSTYLCLQCSFVSNVRERHNKGHGFFVESSSGYIYCVDCRDYIYDETFEAMRTSYSRKRKYSALLQENDQKLISLNSAVTPCAATGLRGLYNMGQTCFMAVILQSLIHNPLLRTFYLSEGHRSIDCDREACTSCALDDIFNEFFGQEKHEGYGAVHMLQGCWKGGGGLAGYSQQDAHEYLGFILNSLHEANTEDDEKSTNNKNSKECPCIVHQTFGGLLQSTVTCLTCKNTTTALDPFMDLSLDVKTAGVSVKKKKLALTNGSQTAKEPVPVDLTECLERFTHAETLSSDSYNCRKCNHAREAKKKLSLSRLPPVIPIHLKRFSHTKSNSQSSKVDTRVRFPFMLDLTPYLTTLKAAPEQKPAKKNADDEDDTIDVKTPSKNGSPGEGGTSTGPEAKYLLSSVVVHKGKIDNGHYISYARQGREWFRFDDSMVVRVEEKEVLSTEAYMLFYVVEEI